MLQEEICLKVEYIILYSKFIVQEKGQHPTEWSGGLSPGGLGLFAPQFIIPLVSRRWALYTNTRYSEVLGCWCPWFLPFALEGFFTLNPRVFCGLILLFFVIFSPSFLTSGIRAVVSS